ncbi:MAG: PKD domain-containing protein, partial [Planctomycetales bacterium]|nr:PKD domain-containing protein [Planctomycetales bacterium]
HETLAANTVGTNITATYAAGVLSLSGSDTPFNYQQILRSVTYHNASQNPTTTPRIIEFTYTRSSVTSPISTTSLTIVSANDAPTVSATENSIVVDEGSIAVNSGVFDDVEGSPTISVDIGTVVDNGNGTWSWSFSALEGPGESQLVTVTATDDLGSAATASFGLTVNNVAPTFHTIVVAPQVNENEPVSLSFSTIAAGTLDTHSILIDWGDGSTSTFPFNTPGGFSFGTNHTYTDDNPTSSPADIYSIVVTVTDDDGGQASFSRDVIVNNVAPAFSTVSLTPTVDENGTVTITGAFSDPGTLDSHTFVVNWGDGNSEAVPFQNATTVLTPVSDTVGRDDNLDGEYELLEADHFEAHTFELMPDRERRFAMEFDLTAFSATDTLQSSILSLYSVGGTPPGLATIEVYGYSGDGTFGAADMQAGYKIAGPFTDSAADLASIDLTSFLQSRLGAGATHAGIVLRSVVVERQTQLASANSSDPALRPKLHVQFANRHTFTTAHPFLDDNAADSYDITVTVTDDDGGIAALTRQVVVSNVAPVLSALTITPEIDENGTVNVSFNGGDVGTIDTHTINIDWGDGSTNTFPFTTPGGFSFGTAHTYLDDNATDSYNVTLTLTDDDGGVAEETRLVTVNNLAPTIAADLSLVTISEGSTATNTGTFSDPGTNDTVLLSASEGQIVDNGNGTWGWSLLTTDGPSESRTITITATDDDRGTSSSTFDLLVNNVVPVATLAGPTTAIKNQQLAFVVSSSDASSHDQAQGVGYIVEFGDGFTIEVSRMLGNSSGFTVYHTYMTTGSFEIKATATDIDGGTSVHAAQTINVAAITSQDLQTSINQVIASGGSEPTIEVLAITETDLDSMINAIGNISLAADAPPVQLVLSLGNMQFSGKTISVPAGVTVTIANGSLTGASPALTVTSGIVVAANVTFNNSTPASTILVNGGNLILRGSTVNETDGGDFAAIEILGGSVDLGTAADAGGNTLHVHGAGQAIRNVTSQAISALGNTFQFDGELAASGYQIEDVVNHALDSTGTGLVTWETGQIYVTHDSGSV